MEKRKPIREDPGYWAARQSKTGSFYSLKVPQESEPLPVVVEEPKKVKQTACSRWKTKLKNMSDEATADVYGHLTMCNAIIVLILNLLLPGMGTILAARFVSTRRILTMQAQEDSSKRVKTSLIFHVGQIRNRSMSATEIQSEFVG